MEISNCPVADKSNRFTSKPHRKLSVINGAFSRSGRGVKLKSQLTLCCQLCPKQFTIIALLRKHYNAHTDANNWQCPYCEHKSSRQGSLVNWRNAFFRHIQEQHLIDPTTNKKIKDLFNCRSCSLSFGTKYQRDSHRCRFSCGSLNVAASTGSTNGDTDNKVDESCNSDIINIKSDVETTDQPNQVAPLDTSVPANMAAVCLLCAQKFTSRKTLTAHYNELHLSTFRCPFCNHQAGLQAKKHVQIYNFFRHVKEQHFIDPVTNTELKKAFGCELCNRKFGSSDALNSHVKCSLKHRQLALADTASVQTDGTKSGATGNTPSTSTRANKSVISLMPSRIKKHYLEILPTNVPSVQIQIANSHSTCNIPPTSTVKTLQIGSPESVVTSTPRMTEKSIDPEGNTDSNNTANDAGTNNIKDPTVETSYDEKMLSIISSFKKYLPVPEDILAVCLFCDGTFSSKKLLHAHYVEVHTDPYYKCPHCKYQAAPSKDEKLAKKNHHLWSFFQHIKEQHFIDPVTNTKIEPFGCKYCDKKFGSTRQRNVHEKVAEKSKNFCKSAKKLVKTNEKALPSPKCELSTSAVVITETGKSPSTCNIPTNVKIVISENCTNLEPTTERNDDDNLTKSGAGNISVLTRSDSPSACQCVICGKRCNG